MNLLTLNDLELGLGNLLTKRRDVLLSCNVGKTYEPGLEAQLEAIRGLPAAMLTALPLAQELAEQDANHDAFGAAIWHMTEAYLRLAKFYPELAAQAAQVRETFATSLADLKAPFADEAMAAKRRRPLLGEHEALLKRFPVANQASLLDWATAVVDHGEKLDELLSERARELETKTDRSRAGALRGQAVGLLGRLRAAVADEVAINGALPRDLEAQIFGYFDELHRRRVASGSGVPLAPEAPKTPSSESEPQG